MKIPGSIAPMLATLVDRPFDEPGWFYKIKWDSYRPLAFVNKGKVELKSSQRSKTGNLPFTPFTL